MKIIKSLAVALLLATSFVACKKDNTPPPFTIEGKWEGKKLEPEILHLLASMP